MGQDEKSIFSGKHIPEDLFTSTSRENSAIKTHMVALFGKDPKQEEIKHFFKKDGSFQAFLEAGNLPSIFSSGENLNVSLFSANLQAYKNYKDENKKYNPNGNVGKNLLYKDYFQKLKSSNLE